VAPLWAGIFTDEVYGQTVLRAMPLLLIVLCALAIAYRFYSAFLAAKVAALDDSRPTPAHLFSDGQNYHPTNRWVLFGHHFAAIAGAGPLIGPVLAIQYGYMPGLIWLVIGVTLAGAVQDMLVLAASVRRGGKSLAQIALTELGRPAAVVVSLAILFIVVIALAGLGYVVVKALGGDEVLLAKGTRIVSPAGPARLEDSHSGVVDSSGRRVYQFPGGCRIQYPSGGPETERSEPFVIDVPAAEPLTAQQTRNPGEFRYTVTLPEGARELVPGSPWGTFTIACTIPIALVMGLYVTRLRKGKGIIEASAFGVVAVLAAVVIGNWVPGSPLEPFFKLTRTETIWALTLYGAVAAVLPAWLLLVPRDYLSSFLKIGTVALIIVGVCLANPALPCPAVNATFADGGPTFKGSIFPFVFICIMCGAISGFHALVSSGTTPKMIDNERDVRPIGYGAMLMEGLVGCVALIVAASLPPDLYYDINTSLPEVPKYQGQLNEMYASLGLPQSKDPLHAANVDAPQHLPADLGSVERMVGGEALRGRTGGAVTLAVGMAFVFSDALRGTGLAVESVMKYWYHFAIMFEALFILTTIDAGTRIARFLLQETLGKVIPRFERTDWLPGSILATAVVTAGWGLLVAGGSISTIWPMFGIANQLLAVLALCLVTTLLINSGRGRYAPITLLPMLFVTATTMSAGVIMSGNFYDMIEAGQTLRGSLNLGLTLFVMVSVGFILLLAASRWIGVAGGMIKSRTTEADT
jgi:carbon starvation protein